MFVLALLTLMLVCDAWWWWRADHLLRPLVHARFLRVFLAIFMMLAIGGLLGAVVARSTVRVFDLIGPVGMVALFVWHFLVLPVVAIPSAVLFVAGKVSGWVFNSKQPSAAQPAVEPQPAGLSRRAFMGTAVAAVPPLVTIGGSIRALDQLEVFRVRRLVVPLATLPAELDGATIAHVTDIHIGAFTRGKTLSRIVEATNALRPDLVLQTGDLINMALSDLPAGVDMSLKMEGRYGQFMCEGNHDLIENRFAFERRANDAGLPLLVNDVALTRVRGRLVQIMGLRWGGLPGGPRRGDEAIKANMDEVLTLRHPDAFQILLAHHPHAFDFAAEANIPLTLSGHTHGGQLQLTDRIGFGPWMYRYWSGLYQKQNSSLVVSNGVGNWFPLRVNAPAEIVHITLKRA